MTRDESLGLGAIHADDDLLDRIGRRDNASFDGLEAMLASWTAQIDADAAAMDDRTGPLGLRGKSPAVAGAIAPQIAPMMRFCHTIAYDF